MWRLFLFALVAAEHGSYKNPNPQPYSKCEANDIVILLACCNDVLLQLDDCKANDLACECCALQSMDPHCHNLCPGNPSTNFLTVLFHDCEELNNVNACNLPFKKEDGNAFRAQAQANQVAALVKTLLREPEEEPEVLLTLYSTDPEPAEIKLKVITESKPAEPVLVTQNVTNVTQVKVNVTLEPSGALARRPSWLWLVVFLFIF